MTPANGFRLGHGGLISFDIADFGDFRVPTSASRDSVV